jgi:hypothetical protein
MTTATRTRPRELTTFVNRKVAKEATWVTRVPDLIDTDGNPLHGNTEEARELLEMMGLVNPGGHRLNPDDVSAHSDVNRASSFHNSSSRRRPALPTHGTVLGAQTLHGGGRLCEDCATAVDRHTPPDPDAPDPEIVEEQPEPEPEPEPVEQPVQDSLMLPTEPPTPRAPKRARCGTTGGYDRHTRLRKLDPTHQACGPCKAKAAERRRKQQAAKKARDAAKAAAQGEGRRAEPQWLDQTYSPNPLETGTTGPQYTVESA